MDQALVALLVVPCAAGYSYQCDWCSLVCEKCDPKVPRKRPLGQGLCDPCDRGFVCNRDEWSSSM